MTNKNTKDILLDFRKSQIDKGVPENEIDEALFIAVNVVAAKTTKELKEIASEEELKQFTNSVGNVKDLINSEKLDSTMQQTIGKDGTSVWSLFNKNLEEFLSKL